MFDSLKHVLTSTAPTPSPSNPPSRGGAVIPAKVTEKQKQLRLGATKKAVERVTAELAEAKAAAARSTHAFRECLASESDATAAKARMKQDAGAVAELEADLVNAEAVMRHAKQELQDATAHLHRAELDDAMATLLSAMQAAEQQFPVEERVAEALRRALDHAAEFASANEFLRSKLLDVRLAYKAYVLKAHRAMLSDGKMPLSSTMLEKPFSAWLPDLDTLPMPAQADEVSP